MKKFRSLNRALKRGHLRVNTDGLFPVLERRSSRNRKVWIKY